MDKVKYKVAKRSANAKWFITLFSLIIIVIITSAVSSAYSDVPTYAGYADEVKRLSVAGLLNGTGGNSFQPDGFVTREQFARVIINTSGLYDLAVSLKGIKGFPDVAVSRWSNGDINAVLMNGLLKGMPDGKFHPADPVTFAQACTVLIRALGYGDKDLSGTWPANYISKASDLKITEGLNFKSYENLPRWALAMMLDRFLMTEIRGTSADTTTGSGTAGTGSTAYQTDNKSFGESKGLLINGLVIDTAKTSSTLQNDQILTDKGTLKLSSNAADLVVNPGFRYWLILKDDLISGIYLKYGDAVSVVVKSVNNASINVLKEGKENIYNLSSDSVYYHNGVKKDLSSVLSALQLYSTAVLGWNDEKTGFDYVAVYDPVFSNPQLVGIDGFDMSKINNAVGSVNTNGGVNPDGSSVLFLKNGDKISVAEIVNLDLYYTVSDISGEYRYVSVYSNKIFGYIKAFKPDRLFPLSIDMEVYNTSTRKFEIKTYELSVEFDTTIFDSDNYMTNQFVNLYIGRDGKIAAISY